jgi:hypothetical protein
MGRSVTVVVSSGGDIPISELLEGLSTSNWLQKLHNPGTTGNLKTRDARARLLNGTRAAKHRPQRQMPFPTKNNNKLK